MAGCVPFFFYTIMSDVRKKKGGKGREEKGALMLFSEHTTEIKVCQS